MKKFVIIFLILLIISIPGFFCFSVYSKIKPFLPYANYLLGKDKPTTYMVMLQNDYEMRANGGFFGSYSVITIDTSDKGDVQNRAQIPQGTPPGMRARLLNIPDGAIKYRFEDIYVPDGQVVGHIDQPAPIQQSFQSGTWRLRDSDWEPDFPTSSRSLRWFMEKGGEISPDIVATLPLSVIKEIVSVVGNFDVPEYQATITPDNFYMFLQGKVELNFFAGSTQKRDVLSAVGHGLIDKMKSLPLTKKYQIASILYKHLLNQNILLNSTNPDFQSFLDTNNYSGKLISPKGDSYLLVEANMGANKANCCIVRQTDHTISNNNNLIHHQINLSLTNTGTDDNPNPPYSYSGHYIAYLRFYLPKDIKNLNIDRHETMPLGRPDIPTTATPASAIKYGFTETGFFHTTAIGTTSKITINYDLPKTDNYSFTILKQHGLLSSPQSIDLFGKKFSTNLYSSQTFNTK